MLENGQIDLLTSAQKTPEREEKFAFSDKAIGSSSAILTVKSGDTRYAAGDYATYSGMGTAPLGCWAWVRFCSQRVRNGVTLAFRSAVEA